MPDLLILDAELRWGSGLGVLASLREDNPNLKLPVILLLDDSGDAANAQSLGSTLIALNKPIPISAIVSAARQVCDYGEEYS